MVAYNSEVPRIALAEAGFAMIEQAYLTAYTLVALGLLVWTFAGYIVGGYIVWRFAWRSTDMFREPLSLPPAPGQPHLR